MREVPDYSETLKYEMLIHSQSPGEMLMFGQGLGENPLQAEDRLLTQHIS